MGGSTPVDISIRVRVWLETVPILLQKLDVKHVHLLSHSAGTMYVLNTLYHHRDILYPDRPYIAMLAPWVHNSHSNATLMNIVSKIPTSLFGSWSNITKFVAGRIMPATAWSGGALAWSGGALTAVGNVFQSSPATENVAKDDAELTPEEKYGVPHEIAQHIEKLRMKYCLAESWAAGNEDAMLCLKKGGTGLWGICEEYPEYVQSLVKLEKSRRNTTASAPKLSMRVFFAESDVMIGKEGAAYFKQCWARDGVRDVIDLQFHDLPGTNHDSAILDVKKGGLKPVFEEVTQEV
ncbi:hypothetical protein LTR86_010576 [Recurvomyces mirabilis]|nr:hypothetical protein LTR86_010576 [Recurvomyces mirabilis]